MKKLVLVLLFLFMVPFSIADIAISTEQNIYNIGNKIRVSASLLHETDFEGFFRTTLWCENYNIQYFLTPVGLEGNFRTSINVPELAAKSPMIGGCFIKADLLTNDNLIAEQKDSKIFKITDKLSVLPVNNNIVALPGDEIKLSGIVNDAFGKNVLKAAVEIELDNNSVSAEAIEGKYSATLQIPKNIKSGRHEIGISASDSVGNSGISSVELYITAVPKYILLETSEKQILPGAKIGIIASVYDQHDDLINVSLDLELKVSSGDKVFKKIVQSNDRLEYEFGQYASPGIYVLASAYRDLASSSEINVTEVRGVNVDLQQNSVIVENIGNIPFDEELIFIIKNKLKNYAISKKIKVEPGKISSLDLSKEVPGGIYDILIALKGGIIPIKREIGQMNATEIVESLEGESLLANDVALSDNRPLYKKIGGSLSSVSGALIGADGVIAKHPLTAPLILGAILLVLVFRYGRKPIIRLIKRKKGAEKKDKKGEKDESP